MSAKDIIIIIIFYIVCALIAMYNILKKYYIPLPKRKHKRKRKQKDKDEIDKIIEMECMDDDEF